MELKDFISMKEPWEYNFEFECAKIRENFMPNEKNFERFFTYKAMNQDLASTGEIRYPEAEIFMRQVKEYGYPKFDCDSCSLSICVCTALWKESLGYKETKCTKNKKQTANAGFGIDTMNSVSIPLGKLVGTFSDEKKAEAKGQPGSRRHVLACFCGDAPKVQDAPKVSEVQKAQDAKKAKVAFRNALGAYGIEDYINAYHTLGNFVLVPVGFNKYRSNKFEDFWDRSLEALHTHNFNLSKKNYRTYTDVIDDEEQTFVRFKNDDFNWYINYFFLWDYVDVEVDENSVKSYKVIDMTGHEVDEKKLSNFFKRTPELIKRRGMFMTAMLIIQDKQPDLYKEIQGYFSDKSDKNKVFLNGVNDAAEKILDKEKEFKKEIPIAAREILVELKEQGEFKY